MENLSENNHTFILGRGGKETKQNGFYFKPVSLYPDLIIFSILY